MKKSILNTLGVFFTLAFAFILAGSNSFAADKNTKTIECKVSVDVSSFYDKDMIEKELKEQKGILEAYVDLDEKIAYVTYEKSATSSENICKVIKDLGYEGKLLEEKDKNFGMR